jgi:hypothetical protein
MPERNPGLLDEDSLDPAVARLVRNTRVVEPGFFRAELLVERRLDDLGGLSAEDYAQRTK